MKLRGAILANLAAVSVIAVSATSLSAQREAPPEQEISDGNREEATKKAAAMSEAIRLADLWFEQYREYERIPALSVALVVEGEPVWSNGYGFTDREMATPATGDTIYSICSISKLFTAVAFMQEWEAGRVRLDEPVSTYLPWATLENTDPDTVPITMRGLLTHSAGLPREAVNPYWTGPDFPFPSQEEIRQGMRGQEPLYPASTTFQYSNLGLTLVGETVEAVSGTPYSDYISNNILRPLEMEATRPFIPAELYGKQMAVGWGSLRADGTRPSVKLFDARGINPAAGFSSSVNDLAKFASWQLRLLNGDQKEILRASTLREMHRVHYITPDRKTSWGLGFSNSQLDDREIVGHGGSCPGYRSSLVIDPKNNVAIALAMNAMENPGQLVMAFGKLLANRIDAKTFDSPKGETIDLAQYEGTFSRQPWWRDVEVLPWAGGLIIAGVSGDDPLEGALLLKPLGGDRFRVVRKGGEDRDVLTFHRDENGSVTHFERFGQLIYRK